MNPSLKICFIVFFLSTFLVKISAQNDFRASLLYDVKMKRVGPYETSETGEWNLLLRFGYRHNHWEYQAFVENFKSISYGAIGVGVNYLFLIEDSKKRFNIQQLYQKVFNTINQNYCNLKGKI